MRLTWCSVCKENSMFVYIRGLKRLKVCMNHGCRNVENLPDLCSVCTEEKTASLIKKV